MIQIVHAVATTIEAAGVLVILGASVASCVAFAREGLQGTWAAAYVHTRANLGRGILLGLEFLVAADIIDTVAVTPTFESLGVLAMIIMIRTLLSFALQVEIDGQWPWRRREAGPDGKCLGD